MRGKKKNKIVFVCTGNTCRSPMAEALFRAEVEKLGLQGLQVCSAGIRAEVGGKLNEKSAQVLLEKGIPPFSFAPKQMDENLVHESLAIVCMTENQRDWLMDFRWKTLRAANVKKIENNVYCFSELVGYEILDPYGRDIDCYRYVFELLAGGMSALTEKLLTEKVREKFAPKPALPSAPKPVRRARKTSAKKSGKKKKKTLSNT